MQRLDIAMVGLGEMGRELALSLARHGYKVGVYEQNGTLRSDFIMNRGGMGVLVYDTLEEMIKNLTIPRKIMLIVPENHVEYLLQKMAPHLMHGDTIMVGTQSHFNLTMERAQRFQKRGIHYVDIGIAGKGHRAAFMVGGEDGAYRSCSRILKDIAQRVEDKPCCDYVGRSGAGHFMKMMHDSILEVDMQIVAEGYQLMRELGRFGNDEIAMVLRYSNEGDHATQLMGITADLLERRDRVTGMPLVEMDVEGPDSIHDDVLPIARAMESPMPMMMAMLSSRYIVNKKSERLVAANMLNGMEYPPKADRYQVADVVIKAMYASRIVNYAQVFGLIKAASMKHKWFFNLGTIARLWRHGFAISAEIFDHIREAYDQNPHLLNLLMDEYFKDTLNDAQSDWRQVIGDAVASGVPTPTMAAALFYYDSYRTTTLPDALIRLQRHYSEG